MDITNLAIDRHIRDRKAARLLHISLKEMIYIGDALFPE